MRIGFLTTDWSAMPDSTTGRPAPGGAGHYRIAMPCEYLRRNGIDAVLGADLGYKKSGEFTLRTHDGEYVDGFDVVVIQRWMDNFAPAMIRAARSTGQTIVSDVDDWMFGLDTTNLAWRATHPTWAPNRNRDHYAAVLRASSGLTVSTPYLADRLARYNENIVVVRNAIELDRFPAQDPKLLEVVGWTGSTLHRSRDLETLRGVLSPWLRRSGWTFFHGGAHPQAPSVGDLLHLPVDVDWTAMPMLPISDYPKYFKRFSVGIVPLSNTPFNHAKSCLKGMEYAASRLPFVAAETPEYEWLRNIGAGRIARRPKDWIRELDRLRDPELRVLDGERNRAAIAHLDITRRWVDWRDAYAELAR